MENGENGKSDSNCSDYKNKNQVEMKKGSSKKSKPEKAKPDSLAKPDGLTPWERLQKMPYDESMTGQGFIVMGVRLPPKEAKNKNEQK